MEKTYTKNEIVEAFGITLLTVDNWLKSGKLKKLETQDGSVAITRESALLRIDNLELEIRTLTERAEYARKKIGFDDEDWI